MPDWSCPRPPRLTPKTLASGFIREYWRMRAPSLLTAANDQKCSGLARRALLAETKRDYPRRGASGASDAPKPQDPSMIWPTDMICAVKAFVRPDGRRF